MSLLVDPAATVERLSSGHRSSEGPIWVAEGGYLLFSDVRSDARFRWGEGCGVRRVAHPTGKAAGMTLDAELRLVVCENSTSRVVRMDASGDGSGVEVIASHYHGCELNSPNDVVVSRDGSVWFTDPAGGRTAAFGVERPVELDFRGVFRRTPDGTIHLVAGDFDLPNGLCFSPDESMLYVNDTKRAHIRAFTLDAAAAVTGERVFAEHIATDQREDGWVDGMKCDVHGDVWVTGPGGIWILDPTGRRIGLVVVPEVALNLHWGGPDWSVLYIAGMTGLYRIQTLTSGRREPFMA